MKKAGQIFSAICFVFIISIHMIQAFKPFEWQRQPEIDPQKTAELLRQHPSQFSPFDEDAFEQHFRASAK